MNSARHVAHRVLVAVDTDDAYSNLLLPKLIRDSGLSAADSGLATELTYGTLRQLGTYNAILNVAGSRDVTTLAPGVRAALQLGTHQLLNTRVTAHAAVNESVELAGASGGKGARGYVNAVLRNISNHDFAHWIDQAQAAARSDDERLSVRTAHPVWIIRALRRSLAAEAREAELDDLLAADNAAPDVTLVALPGLAEPAEPLRPYAPTAFGAPAGDVTALLAASAGSIRVQDEGSQLVALAAGYSSATLRLASLVQTPAGVRWLDLCAGPGGKTALLAALALKQGAELDANELAPHRAQLVREAVSGVPLAVAVSEGDGREFARANAETYDLIVVDAPCSGLGALRRRPEARWRKRSQDLETLVPLQQELVASALEALKPGGVLAYITCSPHTRETDAVIDHTLTQTPTVTALDAREALQSVAKQPLDLAEHPHGAAQLWPHRHGTDAMYLALLRKNG